ncbi:hypothetical protein [uncultured Jannaschia sp.]|uniref:hypothetical protein n=1 Tax=uncultured Jannaschia sp. TaxID=293347 RepID=UPI002611CC87|nr:hypothetical protein [uncultured Jannaschia sp.]
MKFLFLTLATAVALSTVAAAQTDGADATCREVDGNLRIHVLVWNAKANDADLADAGATACGMKTPCGARFFADIADAPETAPHNHDGLAAQQVQDSMGVDTAEDDRLIRITRVTP